jgi:hypothetical protein
MVFSLIRPLLGEYLKNNIIFHSSYESLHEHINQDALPEEFGGNCGKLDNANSVAHVKLMEQYFLDLKKCAFPEKEE